MSTFLSVGILVFMAQVSYAQNDVSKLNGLIFPEQNPGLSIDPSGSVVTNWPSTPPAGGAVTYDGGFVNRDGSSVQGPQLTVIKGKSSNIDSLVYFGAWKSDPAFSAERMARVVKLKNGSLQFVANCQIESWTVESAVKPGACAAFDKAACSDLAARAGAPSIDALMSAKRICSRLEMAFQDKDFQQSLTANAMKYSNDIESGLEKTNSLTKKIKPAKPFGLASPKTKKNGDIVDTFSVSQIMDICSDFSGSGSGADSDARDKARAGR